MAGKEFDIDSLQKKWKKIVEEAFITFAKENLGYVSEAVGPPDCYGSGDAKSYCWACCFQSDC
ncbi:MAG: hypothetical protein ABIL68_10060 [bacterium]